MRQSTVLLAAVILAIGIAAAGGLLGAAFLKSRHDMRVVTVKGMAEKLVEADRAVWPMRIVASGNELAAVQAKISGDTDIVRRFLAEFKIPAEAIELQSLEVNDLHAQQYQSGPIANRFIVNQTLVIRTEDIHSVAKASQHIETLVNQGVVLNNDNYGQGGPNYLYTKLNDIKPAMLKEATANAKEAARQFARDSGSNVGAIQYASQGVFQIMPNGDVPGMMEQKQRQKIIRVVTTVHYFLE